MTPRFTPERAAWLDRMLPEGTPLLWCPLLTHYTAEGQLDRARMQAHLAYLRPSVNAFLVPGSTGDGWQMNDAEVRELLEFMVGQAQTQTQTQTQTNARTQTQVQSQARPLRLLVGVLKTTTAEVLQSLAETMHWLRERSNAAATHNAAPAASRHTPLDDAAVLRQAGICGFTVCPPKGAALSQAEIRDSLDQVLATGLPMALYQLPQVTENEMSADTLAWLAERHPNLLLLKDTSGEDRVAQAGFRDAFLVRGAEGGYSRHLALQGGTYDGLLLSSANGFGPQFAQIVAQLQAGQVAEANALSDAIAAVMSETFAAAAPLPCGNVFTNANKAIDHFMAHGPGAAELTGPRLHSGDRLPPELIAATGAALARHGLMPTQGYLAA